MKKLSLSSSHGSYIIYVNGQLANDHTALGRLVHDFSCLNPKDIYEIVEDEKTNEFFVIENNDIVTINENSEMNKILDGLKDTLTNIVTLLKEEKKGA